MKRLSCGSCGNNNRFYIYADDQDDPSRVVVECVKCHSKTTIEPQPSKIVIGWGEQSEGILSFIEPLEAD